MTTTGPVFVLTFTDWPDEIGTITAAVCDSPDEAEREAVRFIESNEPGARVGEWRDQSEDDWGHEFRSASVTGPLGHHLGWFEVREFEITGERGK